ncbi:MAG: MTAP family purine nucleoside phosphorylase [Phycisphaerae bacterium]|nr:MTAP family purine nucleoside phosphorylase [Phycisphaerae bacterium]
MAVTLACIGGRAAYDLLHEGALLAERLGTQATPFGDSQPIYRCKSRSGEFYFLSRHGETRYERTPTFINYRANIYALKDLGVRCIVSWSETRAISHNFKIGQYVVVDDLLDETVSRPQTFFENRGLGHIRQWPVFCPSLRKALIDSLVQVNCEFSSRGVYVCVEGPRHETPAEARKYAAFGGELLGQALVPEVFLAHELQMCYASLCYVARFAEDGTNYRPFEDGRALTEKAERTRATAAVERIPRLLERFCHVLPETPSLCQCESSMAAHTTSGELGLDWRTWFDQPELTEPPRTDLT